MIEYSKIDSDIVVQIIDDDKIIRSMLTKVLNKSGYQVIVSDNGPNGIKQYKQEKPDIILLDVLMPGMTGYEVCMELRKPSIDPALPILMLTGLDDMDSINEAFRVGATDFVTKPINLALLGQRVKYALKGKKMYDEVQQKTNELAAILDSASDGILSVDDNYSILDINRAGEILFQSPKESMLGKNLLEYIMGLEKLNCDDLHSVQLAGKRANGDIFPIEVSVSLITQSNKTFKSIFVHDLTERVKIERMKGEFIQTVSHELRTPITAIKGAVGILNSGVLGEVSPDAEELVRISERACTRLESLVDDILDVTTLEDPLEELNYTEIVLSDVVNKITSSYLRVAEDRQIKIEYNDEPDVKIHTDENRLSGVFRHLLSNAIKFSNRNSVVEIRVQQCDSGVKITLINQGAVIPEGSYKKVFEKFYQEDNSSTRNEGGTGLGLYIVKTAIEKLQGHVDVNSTLENGTAFSLFLPRINWVNPDVS